MRCPRMSLYWNMGITSLSEIRRVGDVVDHTNKPPFFLRLSPLFLFQQSHWKAIWDSVVWISLIRDAMALIEPLGNLCQSVLCNPFALFKEFGFLVLEVSFLLLGS